MQSDSSPARDDVARSDLPFPVVGIGASAGGIVALTRFFEKVESPCGMAFVVILHLSPHHESVVAEILQRVTRLTVLQVQKSTRIEADHVYVIPPTKDLRMDDGHLAPVEVTRGGGPHVAIDVFLRTLAEAHGDHAFAIVLSGMGSDGAIGLRRVNERGGVTFAQLPADAEFDSMPRAAVATGLIDFVLPVDEMPARLRELSVNMRHISLPSGGDPTGSPAPNSAAADDAAAEKALRETLKLLQRRTRHDFRQYKRATVLRRLERRLQVNALPDLATYRDFLEKHPGETQLLLQDMLISVTSFFRDREVFDALEHIVIPALLADRDAGEPVRVWIAGCATGEEAYSIAMLLREKIEVMPEPPQIQIFATDIDERAITYGRAALYPEGIAADVSGQRLRRFFTKEGDRYRVAKAVRESVLFAVHNVLRDPPFSRLDLVSCRNLLIYLDASAQKAMLDTFRFALRDDGFMLLGSSESADSATGGFRTIEKKHRLFQSSATGLPARRPIAPATLPEVRTAIGLPLQDRKLTSHVERHRWALERYSVPSVLVNEQQQILHLSPTAGPFFVRGGGTPSHDLVANIHPDLRIEMRAALFRAAQSRRSISARARWSGTDGHERRVVIGVHPFDDPDTDEQLVLLTLQEVEELSGHGSEMLPSLDRDAVVLQLETEVGQLKGYLQETIERSDTSTEELKASNEELQAINEELRSASEELETSKEELQSINEELTTVNYELKVKVDETIQVNDDLQNLIASTDIAVVFVDSRMRVKRFTPRATDLFNLIGSDVGRSLLDITHRLEAPSITQDAEEAFRTLRIIEREVRGGDDRHYLSKVIPYRTVENKIEGAVMTFVDITSLVKAEKRVRDNEERLRIAAETVRQYAIVTLDEDGLIATWNLGARETFGYDDDEVVGKHVAILFTPEDREAGIAEKELRGARETGSAKDERWHLRKDGSRFYSGGVMTSYQSGDLKGFVKILQDVTGTMLLETRRDEELSREKQAGLAAETANRMKDEFLAVMSHELKHPLNLIHVNAELLTRMPEAKLSPGIRRAAETIRRTVASQARIIDDLLDLSRARTGKMMMTMMPTPLAEIVERIVGASRGDATTKQIVLTLERDPGDELIVACDSVRFEQIAWNLLSNAIKFTPAGGHVVVRLARRPGEAVLQVTDTGRGIAPAFIGSVFTMFKQERREMTNGEGGMGIGLALVKELTEAQGGRVSVTSPGVGQGATFEVALPMEDGLQTTNAFADDGADGPLRGLRILAIDDSAEALEPFAELLRIEGAVVTEGHSGQAALEILDRESFDLMISDVGMPGMDGYQLVNEVRQRKGDALVAIAMSGYGRSGDVQRATEVGFDAHLTKPASVDDFKTVLARLRQSGRFSG